MQPPNGPPCLDCAAIGCKPAAAAQPMPKSGLRARRLLERVPTGPGGRLPWFVGSASGRRGCGSGLQPRFATHETQLWRQGFLVYPGNARRSL